MNNNPTFLVLEKVRLSFVHLFTPRANQPGGDAKYSTTILLPKSNMAAKQRIDMAVQAAAQAGVSSKWNGVMPAKLATPIYDGDGVRPNGDPFGPECKGHWVFTASSKQKPEIIDLNMNCIINQSEIYSGIYANVSLNLFPYASNGNRGIGCGLGNVQKVSDGEPLGGRTTAAEDFANVGQQSAQPQYAPQAAYQPQAQYQPQPQYAPQPTYQAQPQYPAQPVQPQYAPQPTTPIQPQQPQLDPITGKPIGGVMGL